MPTNNVYDNRFDPSTYELERMLDYLIPRSNPSLKHTLLESNQTGMTSINLARSILRESNRLDVKVCIDDDYIQDPEIDLDRQYLKQSQPLDRNYLIRSIGAIVKWGLTLLCWSVNYVILLVVIFLIIILIPPSICCFFICKIIFLLTEIDASVRAMYILKYYKILDVRQLKAARKFLIASGFTYLLSFRCTR